jgi:hypothetical protein
VSYAQKAAPGLGPPNLGEVDPLRDDSAGGRAFGWEDCREVPHPRVLGPKPKKYTRLRSPPLHEALAITGSEIAGRNRSARRGDVALDEIRLTADFHTSERPNRLEHHDDAARIPRQVAELDVPFRDHDLK